MATEDNIEGIDIVTAQLCKVVKIASLDSVTLYHRSERDCVVKEIEEDFIVLDKLLLDESVVLVSKVEYPKDVQMGVVEMLKWKLKNEAANDGDVSKKTIQSETISRHSVTYATDSSEADLDEELGVPKKHTAFLKHHKKARF